MRRILILAFAALVAVACGDDDVSDGAAPAASEAQRFPDILDVAIVETAPETFRVDVTISSPYDTPERYADAWRVLSPTGEELGIRVLTHDHADEQPFTRSLRDISIAADVVTVDIEPRDLVNGWSGVTTTVEVPHGSS